MTPKQAGEFESGLQKRRIEYLSKTYPFASEILNFYSHILAFQNNLRANLDGTTREDSNWAGHASLADRSTLDLALLLPHFRGFLSMVEQHAPAALSKTAHELSSQPAGVWIERLQEYWKSPDANENVAEILEQFLPRAFLQPHAELLGKRTPRAPSLITVRLCPVCGGKPLMGVLRQEGDGGKRYLLCSFCMQEWEFRRIHCAACNEENEKRLPVYVAEQFPQMRVEACETCKFYVRCVDLTKDGNALPLIDDLAAIPLTLWAEEQGFRRLQQNLLGT
jgi:FdhE protein